MRLIDADALYKYITNKVGGVDCAVLLDNEIAPTIDAVEVVRCKECKHSHMTYDGRCKYCGKWEGDGEALYLEGDFYCAFGERREDGKA